MIKKLIKIGLTAVMTVNFVSSVYAQDNETSDIDPYIGKHLSIARCISKGNLDFITFLSASSFSDGFYEAVIEPWNDILMRNQCHSNDVLSLIKQRNKLRKYIRDAFLTCNTQKIPSLRLAHFKINAEIYYVRHVVDGSIVVSLPYNLLSTRMAEDEDSLYYPREKLYNEMKERYIENGEIPRKEFDLLFEKLEFKYRDRKKTYIICETSSWESVIEKWNEFIDTAGGITPAWKNMEKGVGGRAEKIVEAATDMGFDAYMEGLVQVNLNNMGIKPGFGEISENIDYYLPNIDIPTQSAFLEAMEVAESMFDTEEMRQKMLSNFGALYRDTSDSSLELILTELENFNIIILESFNPLDGLTECAETINNRQCPK
ncbi:hypothetical protein GF366_00220 [Candidatus Peregrinibacteria bacterium]|nr:hypothetical protein [Candidatus Peregrinibacteria bacterium]